MLSDNDWRRHLYALNLTENEYKAWCKAKGLRTSRKKSKNDLLKELQYRQKEWDLSSEKKRIQEEKTKEEWLQERIKRIISKVKSKHNKEEITEDLKIINQTGILRTQDLFREDGSLYEKVVTYCLEYKAFWVRDLKEWNCININPDKIIANLVQHLFFKYPISPYWTKSFFETRREVEWAISLGAGQSIRTLKNFPFPLSHKEAHAFEKNLDFKFKFKEGLIYSLVLTWCSNHQIANSAAQTQLSENYFTKEDKIFWEPFFTLLKYQMFDSRRLREVIDYLIYERGQNPSFTIKGRTLASLYRRAIEWHQAEREKIKWKGRTNREFKKVFNDWTLDLSGINSKEIWTMVQLNSDKQLYDEGEAMHHCVFTYGDSCAQGYCQILSLRKNGERIATIEIRGQVLAQAKLKYNGLLKAEERLVLEEWLKLEKIKFNSFII